MKKTSWHISRRTFLRGLGTAIALPTLEAMVPPLKAFGSSADPASPFPKRMAFVYVPNGANMADWTPGAVGSDFTLPYILEPLQAHRKDLLVLSGLAQDKARPHGDGAGDHARASATFLTGCQARKTPGADIKVGVSADQIAAEKIGGQTRFASLELGCDRGQQSGNCDSGYSCAYQFNLSWRGESSPLPPEIDPRHVFERLFANADAAEAGQNRAIRQQQRKSILDFALEDARQLKSKLGFTDRRKLDEYLAVVRELEQRIERAEKFAAALPDYTMPTGVPSENEDHIRLMFDLLTLAFQTDTTRIVSFLIAHDGSNRSYPKIGISEGHHELSHHGNNEEKKAKIAKINRYHVTQFAYLLEKLKSIPEGEGTLLDNCMIVYGSGIADGNAHNHDNLPVLVAGRGGDTLTPGRHIRYEKETPMTNLYVSMLERVGAPVARVGDSTGTLRQLS